MGQLLTHSARTARPDIVGFQVLLSQPSSALRVWQFWGVSFIPLARTFPVAGHPPEGQGGRAQRSFVVHSLGAVESGTWSRRL